MLSSAAARICFSRRGKSFRRCEYSFRVCEYSFRPCSKFLFTSPGIRYSHPRNRYSHQSERRIHIARNTQRSRRQDSRGEFGEPALENLASQADEFLYPFLSEFRTSPAGSGGEGCRETAGATGGARDGRPRHSRTLRMATEEWIAATIFIGPRQRGHSRTSMAHTRFISSAHV